ncbi:MAG: maleylpyruvate isomerase N-terminal domain-containing protein [Anaerolineae bacterium]|nr:maleylpyruvate isomerase N-terminal domain-containing protein [Anaerolineae bacterium]
MTDKKTELKQKLAQTRTELETLLTSLTPEQWHTPIISEGNTWTVLDIVAHLVENERGMSIHVHKIRQGKDTVPDSFDLTQWNAGLKGRMGNPTPAELLQNLARNRVKTLEVLDSIGPEEWGLTGRHPARGLITIEQYYETMADHDAGHADDIRKALALKN